MAGEYVVNLTGGGPWGFRLQGGKDFGTALSIARVTPGGKADLQGILEGDFIDEINQESTEHLVHLDAQNLIKSSKDTLKLRLVRKAGNTARSMGSKSPVVITDTTHSARVDHKFNAKPRPFGVQSSPVQVKSLSKPAKDPDNYDDSEVLRMLRNSSINDSGLTSRHADNDIDDLPPPPPEAYSPEDEQLPAGQSRSFKLLQRHVDGGDSHPSVFSQPDGDRNRAVPQSRPYTVTANVRGGKPPVQTPMNTKEPPPCPPGVKPMQVLPSEINFTRPSDAARAAYAERRQTSPQPTSTGVPSPAPAFQSYRPAAAPAAKPKPTSPASNSQLPHCHGCGQNIQGSFLSALGRNWHPEHFNCAGCRKSLQNKGFVEESDHLYCENCYDMKFAPHCDVCNQAIVGPCVKAIGKMFHPEHFICAHCGKQIANESFHLDSGKPYCAQDYKELFCVKCCSCKQVIGGGDRWLEALDKPWHADCFRCAVCGSNLENTGFYSMGTQAVCPEHA
ncbi:PDZ and LIM domain protein 7-like isoform X2 [Dendronephthya gigantea]|uniref:PDZ and LIM domain protein 7-like isoform X2 n=1 Tax=Dendronephthya gigantea TaxID=151771 RepID=UPI00106CB5A4|nr:PDZ and LIM domain protein 7-like isoform X2 [Dendronephthya gigantea]